MSVLALSPEHDPLTSPVHDGFGRNPGRTVIPAEVGNEANERQDFAFQRAIPSIQVGTIREQVGTHVGISDVSISARNLSVPYGYEHQKGKDDWSNPIHSSILLS
jgi:hypothetical protein